MPAPTFAPHRCQGFTLVETIIVLVVVAIAAAGITVMTGNIFSSQEDNKTLQVGLKNAQECAEHIVAMRRRASTNFSSFTPSCPMSAVTGFVTPDISFKRQSDTGGPTCPPGTTACMLITISPRASVGGGGTDELTPIFLLLVGP